VFEYEMLPVKILYVN